MVDGKDAVRELSIKIKLDNVKEAQKEVDELKKIIEEGVDLKVLKKGSSEWKDLQSKLKSAQNNLAKEQGFSSFNAKQISELASKALGGVKGKLVEIAANSWEVIVGIATDAWDEIKKASVYSSSSKLYSSEVTNLRMQYGFSGSEAYAFQQAFKDMGLDDIAKMSPEQRNFYTGLYEQYLEEYKKMEDSGTLQTLQDIQLEWEQFQRDLKFTFMDFIADNKETIKTFLDLGIELAKVVTPAITEILKGITWVINRITGYKGVSSADVINNWSSASSVKNNNQVNNFNISGSNSSSITSSIQSAMNNAWEYFGG